MTRASLFLVGLLFAARASAQVSASFTCSATPDTVLDLTGGSLANGVTTYTSTNGVVVTSSRANYSNTVSYYFLGYLFNNTFTTTRTNYWLTDGNATLTITLPQPTPIDRVRVLSIGHDAQEYTNYKVQADKGGTLVDVTSTVPAGLDRSGLWREHGVYAAGIATTTKIVITATRATTYYAALNEVQLVLQTCTALPACPTSPADGTRVNAPAGGMGSCMLTPTANYNFTGDLTVNGPLVAPTWPMSVTLSAGSIWVTAAGGVDMSGRGDAALTSPGYANSGAGHGGFGGGETGGIYGSIIAPTTLGAGSLGSPGGGHLTLEATNGSVIVDGVLKADGRAPSGTCNYSSGAGGSVRIIASQAVGGTGSVSARGAAACDSTRRSGGGGRIAITAASELVGSSLLEQLYVSGGAVGSRGGSGSIYTAIGALRRLTYDNESINGAPTTLTNSDLTLLGSGWDLEIGPGALVRREGLTQLVVNSVYIANGGTLTHAPNSDTASPWAANHVLDILTSDFEIAAGGKIDVVADGYDSQLGPGAGLSSSDGAAHGGLGGNQTDTARSYGDYTTPNQPGSGGFSTTYGGRGGGVVDIESTGRLAVNGTIDANGQGGSSTGTAGGGSGGSVWLNAATFTGSGTITAQGGHASNDGTGGGGRIAIEYSQNTSSIVPTVASQLPDATKLSARGGYHTAAPSNSGGAGTVYLRNKTTNIRTLIINNGENPVTQLSPLRLSTGTPTVNHLLLAGRAQVTVPSGVGLVILSGGSLIGTTGPSAVRPYLHVAGTLTGPSATWSLDGINARFESTSTLTSPGGAWDLSLFRTHFVFGGAFAPLKPRALLIGDGATMTWLGTYTDATLATGKLQLDDPDTAAVNDGTLVVAASGVLTHEANTTSTAHRLWIDAKDLEVQLGGTIHADAKGFNPEAGTAAGISSSHGGGHGGPGGYQTSNPTYGSFSAPTTLGSGGFSTTYGGRGGGSIRLNLSGTLTLDGALTANGQGGSSTGTAGAGAGGSVWITTHRIRGTGPIRADGGHALNDGTGGGGRVAIEYATDESSILPKSLSTPLESELGQLSARAGKHTNVAYNGGAGTIFLRQTTSGGKGTLIFDAGGVSTSLLTTISNAAASPTSLVTHQLDHVALLRLARLRIPANHVLELMSGGLLYTPSVAANARPRLVIDGSFKPPQTTLAMRWVDVDLNGTFQTTNQLTLEQTNFNLVGNFASTMNALTVGAGALLTRSGLNPIDVLGSPGRIIVANQGMMTHTANAGSRTHVLHLRANELEVTAGGTIQANGRGHDAESGLGGGYSASIGGSHGGLGGRQTGLVTHGRYWAPTSLGGGGYSTTYGGAGGGAIRLEVGGVFKLDGTVAANGLGGTSTGAAGGGAGGSIWLTTDVLEGSGTLQANGGSDRNDGAGGGGRIAVEFRSNFSAILPSLTAPTSPTSAGKLSAKGGTHASINYSGGAGTIYLRDRDAGFGTLILDNADNKSNLLTPIFRSNDVTAADPALRQLDQVALCRGANLQVPAAISLQLASGGLVHTGCSVATSARSLLQIDAQGVFSPPQTSLVIKNLDVTLSGTFNTTTDLTLESSRFILEGAFAAGLSSLTIGAGATLERRGTSEVHIKNGLGKLVVASGGTLTHTINETSTTSRLDIRANDVEILTGGRVFADGLGFAAQSGTGAGNAAAIGGSHGGFGGRQTSAAAIYGDFRAPITLGSGGYYTAYGGRGGGAIRLDVSGTMRIDGDITANGLGGTNTGNAGGGAGGSIQLRAQRLTGDGKIQARGGHASNDGAGGGGRIALYYGEQSFNGITQLIGSDSSTDKLSAKGGTHTVVTDCGAAGTILLTDTAGADADPLGVLVIDNANNGTEAFTLLEPATAEPAGMPAPPTVTLTRILLKNRGNVQVTSPITLNLPASDPIVSRGSVKPNFRIDSGATYRATEIVFNNIDWFNYGALDGTVLINFQNGQWSQYSTVVNASDEVVLGHDVNLGPGTLFETSGVKALRLTGQFRALSGATMQHVANTGTGTTTITNQLLYIKATKVTLEAGAKIDVTGRGFPRAVGAGRGTSGSTSGGGAHGGAGGRSSASIAGGATTYGVNTAPVTVGSGGGDDTDGTGTGGAGGGLARFEVCGEFRLDGAIIADGQTGRAGQGGGGAGGSIFIDATSITGSGSLSANGGNGAGTSTGGGGGGGGRIALRADSVAATITSSVAGGAKGGTSATTLGGSAGSFYQTTSVAGLCGSNPCGTGPCAGVLTGGVCVYTSTNGNSCSDSSMCTVADKCMQGLCVPGPAANCDDGNDCTVDSCNPFDGCKRSNRVGSCDDKNACTVGTTCLGDTCTGGTNLVCNDGNICTDDYCDPISGCKAPAGEDGLECIDGITCTTGDSCQSGSCVGLPTEGPGCYGVFGGPPVIGPPLSSIELDDGQPGILDLTAYENDLESGPANDNNQLTWSVVDVDPGLLTASVNSQTDVLTLTPVSATVPFETTLTVRLTDGEGLFDDQVVDVVHDVSDFLLTLIASPSPAIPNGDRVTVKAVLSSPLGLPLSGRAVQFSLVQGDGKLFPFSRLTNASGEATVALLPGTQSPHIIRATYTGSTTLTVDRTLVVEPPERDAAIFVTDITVHDPVSGDLIDVSQIGAILPDSEIEIRARVRNLGRLSTDPFLVSFSASRYDIGLAKLEAPVTLGTVLASVIAPSTDTVVKVKAVMPNNGFHLANVVVDANGTFAEGNENNNRASLGFWVGAPDDGIDPTTEGLLVTCDLASEFTAPTGVPGVKPGDMLGISGRADYAALAILDPSRTLGHAAVRGGRVELSLRDASNNPVTVSAGALLALPTSGLAFPALHTIAMSELPADLGHYPNRSGDDIWDTVAPSQVGCYTLKVCVKDSALGGCCEKPFCVVPEGPELVCDPPRAVDTEDNISAPRVGQETLLSTVIKNKGDFAATNVRIEPIVKGVAAGAQSVVIASLEAGATTTATRTWTPSCGNSPVGFKLYWGSSVPGDTATRSTTCVSPLPDVGAALIRTQKSASGVNACDLDVVLTKSVVATRELPASETRAVFSIKAPNGTVSSSTGTSGIKSSRAEAGNFGQLGVYEVTATVDGPLGVDQCGDMPERDESLNNVLTQTLCADVQPGDPEPSADEPVISVTPWPFKYGEPVTVTTVVHNAGELPLPANLEVELSSRPSENVALGEAVIGSHVVSSSCEDALEPHRSTEPLTWTWTPTYPSNGAAEHRALRVDVDTNDVLTPCGVEPASDVATLTYGMNLKPIAPEGLALNLGEPLEVGIEVTHQGGLLPRDEGSTVAFDVLRADDTHHHSATQVLGTLESPDEDTPYATLHTFTWTPSAVDCNPDLPMRSLGVEVDANERYVETNEIDNAIKINLPDLVVAGIERKTVGCQSELWLKVDNIAPQPRIEAGTWSAKVRVLRPDGTTSLLDVLGSGAGSVKLHGAFTSTDPGTYTFDVELDTGDTSACGDVLESNEKNNRATRSVNLCADPAFVGGIELTPLGADGQPANVIQHGVPIDIRATITNAGALSIDRPVKIRLGTRLGNLVNLPDAERTIPVTCENAIGPTETRSVVWEDVVLSPLDGLDTLVATIDADASGIDACSAANDSTERALWLDLSPWTNKNGPNYSTRRDLENKDLPTLNWDETGLTLQSNVRLLPPPPYARDRRGEQIRNPIFLYPSDEARPVDYAYVRRDRTRQVFATESYQGSASQYPVSVDFDLLLSQTYCNPANPIQHIEAVVDPQNTVLERIEDNQRTTRPLPNLQVTSLTRTPVVADAFNIEFVAGSANYKELYIGTWDAVVALEHPDGSAEPIEVPAKTGPFKRSQSAKVEGTAKDPVSLSVLARENGRYRASVTVDPPRADALCGDVPERDELDNESKLATWYLCPELGIQVDMVPGPTPASPVTIKAKVRNKGTRSLAENMTVRLEALDASDQVVASNLNRTTAPVTLSRTQPMAVGETRTLEFIWTPPSPNQTIKRFRASVEVQDTLSDNGDFPEFALCSKQGSGPVKTGNIRSEIVNVPLVLAGCETSCPEGDATCVLCPTPPEEPGCEILLASTPIRGCEASDLGLSIVRPLSRDPLVPDDVASLETTVTLLDASGPEELEVAFEPDEENEGAWIGAIDELPPESVGAAVRIVVSARTTSGDQCFAERTYLVTGGSGDLTVTGDNITFVRLTSGTHLQEGFTAARVGDLAEVGMTVTNGPEACLSRDVTGKAYIDLGYTNEAGEPARIMLGHWWIDSISAGETVPIQFYAPSLELMRPLELLTETFVWQVQMPSPWLHKVTLEVDREDAPPLVATRMLQVGDLYSLSPDMELRARIQSPVPGTEVSTEPQMLIFSLGIAAESEEAAVPAGFSSPVLGDSEPPSEPLPPEEISSLSVTVIDQDGEPVGAPIAVDDPEDIFIADGLYGVQIDPSTTEGSGFSVVITAVTFGAMSGGISADYLLSTCVDNDGDGAYGYDLLTCSMGTDCDDNNPTSTLKTNDNDCDGSLKTVDCDDDDPAITGPCGLDCLLETQAFDPALASATLSAENCVTMAPTLTFAVRNDGTATLEVTSLEVSVFGSGLSSTTTAFHTFAVGDAEPAAGTTTSIASGASGTFSYTLPSLPTGVTEVWVVLNHGASTTFVGIGGGWRTAGAIEECHTTDNDGGPLTCASTAPGACLVDADCAAASDTCDTVSCDAGMCTVNDTTDWQTCEEENRVYVTVKKGAEVGYMTCTRTVIGGEPVVDCERNPDGTGKVTLGNSGGVCAP